MAKKYVSLEEAAQMLGIPPDELVRRREKGEIRGFADRGTWKFKTDDLEEFNRRRQADSNPDVPILADSDREQEPGSSSVFGGEEDEVGEQSTAIRSGSDSGSDMSGTSDSDVRLILDDELQEQGGGGSAAGSDQQDSDSDVQLVDESDTKLTKDSDSDVELVDEDTQGDMATLSSEPGSDSDVRLIQDEDTVDLPGSSEDVEASAKTDALSGSDSDVTLVPAEESGSSVVLEDESGSSVLSGESGPSLTEESGISLAAESGISLDGLDDSGISLETDQQEAPAKEDSGLTLAEESGSSIVDAAESGLSLEAEESGISLEQAADSGISLAEDTDKADLMPPDDSGIALESDEAQRTEQTVPMMKSPDAAGEGDETELEVPSIQSDDESEFELQLDDTELDASDDSSSVLLFEEEDEDEFAPTAVKKAGDEDLLEDFEDEAFDLESAASGELEVEDDLDVADEILGEDDELEDLEVEFAADEDFDEALETGESHADFVATPRGMAQAAVAPVEAEWGTMTFVGLLASTLFMALCMMLMFDLARSMWAWQQPTAFNSALLDLFGNLFG